MLDIYLWISVLLLTLMWLLSDFMTSWLFFTHHRVKFDLGIPPFGSCWRVILNKESWSQTLKRIYYKFPNEKFIGLTEVGGHRQWLIRHPELIKQITIFDFNHFVNRIDVVHSATDPLIGHELTNLKISDWRQMRTILTPMLSGQRLKKIAIPALNENKIDLVTFLKNEIKLTKDNVLRVDVMDLMTRSGIDAFCLTALSLKTDSLHKNGQNYGFYDYCKSYYRHSNSVSQLMYQLILKFPRVMKYIFGKTITHPDGNKFFAQSCQSIADKRIENQFERQDYLDLLQKKRDRSNGIDGKNDKNRSDIEIISQVFEFYESVILENNVLSAFIAQRLAENLDIQQRLYEEFHEIQQNLKGETLTHETINQMKYMDMIVSEALRMCPIAPELKRRATKPYSFTTNDGKIVPIKPGDAIWIPMFILQTDPIYYPDPDVFNPERFSDPSSAKIPGTYGPYGMGHRDCIGCQYSTNEAKITFYHLVLAFIIETDKKGGYNVQFKLRN